MEKRISNSFIIIVTIICLIVIVVGYAFYKYSNQSEKDSIYSMNQTIKYYAKRCYLEEKCNSQMTLNDLYKNGYTNEIKNPVTKEVLDPNTIINYNDGNIIIEK